MKRRDGLIDGVLLTVLVVAAVLGGVVTALVAGSQADLSYAWVFVALQVVTSAVVLVRRRRPAGAALTIVLAAIAQTLVAFAAPLTVGEALLSVSAWIPLALSVVIENITERGVPPVWSAAVWALIGLLTLVSVRPWDPTTSFVVNGLLHSAVAPLFALYLAARRRKMALLGERAERAEREQWWRAERARAEERARLATELHDLVAHRVTLMTLQAGALSVRAPDDDTRGAAEDLRANGALALDELRELVGVLRRGGRSAEAPLDEAPLPPLAHLVDEAGRAGQEVALVTAGEPSMLSRVTGRTAYRVVREALTNARKHAGGAPVRVDAEYLPEHVRIVVHNGAGRSSRSARGNGAGLAGLRERVESIGGTLVVGPDGAGGFRLETVMPVKVTAERGTS
ncbi:sensor histidine kinase [Paractinoplanes hotanensis]|uniref:histidine kinase n=1 Tax=Paractinoplanes hotanensis TaxID=2906497 RepID=A0ABT0XUR0_9ACTN|nr:histidine kinase [Actinoplanes hotanensis]MCM4077518.1 histidine kinase [Actinoplanes hotanensis]